MHFHHETEVFVSPASLVRKLSVLPLCAKQILHVTYLRTNCLRIDVTLTINN
jgi:hypothetical protein